VSQSVPASGGRAAGSGTGTPMDSMRAHNTGTHALALTLRARF
jgi:hypothetical protein